MTQTDTAKSDSLLARLDATTDLAPVGARRAVPITINGTEYAGVMVVPIEELALCSAADYDRMKHAQRSHRSRRLRDAAKSGELTPEQVKALQARGVLPDPL